MAVGDFVIDRLFHGVVNLDLQGNSFGCSTLSVPGTDGTQFFGRNFDWGACATLIVQTHPRGGYASISTVNMDFLNLGLNLSEDTSVRLMSAAAPYAPMDGMNAKGLCVAVLMIEDRPGFDQNTGKTDLTTTSAVRLLLDKAATVDEALALLERYDLHASAGMMVHFAIADASGRSVAVEYVNNEMSVVETPIVTNFYLTPGEKYGIGTEESHRRYEILTETLADHPSMTAEKVRDAMDSRWRYVGKLFDSRPLDWPDFRCPRRSDWCAHDSEDAEQRLHSGTDYRPRLICGGPDIRLCRYLWYNAGIKFPDPAPAAN